MQAEIIAIGTELLLGNTLDTNTHYLANLLRRLGVDLFRTSMVGDNAERIAQTVHESLTRAELVITSGGLGPTIDDATREGIARALDRPLEFQPVLWEQIKDRFKRYGRQPTENNRRQAYIPQGAQPLENPVGTAPAFYIEIDNQIVISLPGVPGELTNLAEHALIPLIRSRMETQYVILTRIVRTAGVGESWLDQIIQDLEYGHNPTVGLSAQPGRVDIRITAKADRESLAEEMLDQIETELRQRIGDHIYGVDEATLETAIADLLHQRKAKLHVWIGGFSKEQRQLVSPLEALDNTTVAFETASKLDEIKPAMQQAASQNPDQISLGLSIAFGTQNSQFDTVLCHQGQWIEKHRSFGGAPQYAHPYALSHALDLLRRYLLDN
jgi:competence/damage-inducible protein CinA-like protein